MADMFSKFKQQFKLGQAPRPKTKIERFKQTAITKPKRPKQR